MARQSDSSGSAPCDTAPGSGESLRARRGSGLAGLIDGWKNRALTPSRVPAGESQAYDGRGAALYEQYQRRLLELNAADFGDLLLHCVTIFQAHPDVLAQWQDRFRYILVDEYQDTNVAQYLWLDRQQPGLALRGGRAGAVPCTPR